MLSRSYQPRRSMGVTLIELAVAMAVFAIIIMFGLPSFLEWTQNTQLRTAAEGLRDGLATARMEAIRRNSKVEFILSSPGTTGGSGWEVRLASTAERLQAKPNGEASASAVLAVTPNGSDRVTFDGLGRQAANADTSASLTQIDIDSATLPAAQSRELRIVITSGGAIRMCDPQVATSTDPRKC